MKLHMRVCECVGSELLGHIKVPITVNSAEFSIYCETQSLNFAMNAISDQRNVEQHNIGAICLRSLGVYNSCSFNLWPIIYRKLSIVSWKLYTDSGTYMSSGYLYLYIILCHYNN